MEKRLMNGGLSISAFSEKTPKTKKSEMVTCYQKKDTQNQVAAPAATGDVKGTREKILAAPV